MEKLRESGLGGKVREQLYSKLQAYIKLLKEYEQKHGKMGRIVLEKDIKRLEAEGKGRAEAVVMLARMKGIEISERATAPEAAQKPSTSKTVAVVELGPEEEETTQPQAERSVDELVRVISPVDEETLTPPKKAEPPKKSRQEPRSVARPRPTELPILAALSAVNGVISFAAAWLSSVDPRLGLPFAELFTNPAQLISGGSFLPLLELASLVLSAVFFVATAFTLLGRRWAWNLMFGVTAVWMSVMALTAAFVNTLLINVALATLVVSTISFYYMTSESVKAFFKA